MIRKRDAPKEKVHLTIMLTAVHKQRVKRAVQEGSSEGRKFYFRPSLAALLGENT